MFRSGDQIGPYTLMNKLGRGAFGVVWLAERRTQITTTVAAIKIPHDEEISIETIKNEADVWVRASGHPNVLPIIEADIYGDHVIIASEYAPDGSLDAYLKDSTKDRSIETAVDIVAGILSGLEHLHSRNIIHRDLKPANILFQGTTPRLADFGISRVLKSTNQSSNIMGTPSYMAPEAFDGKRNEQTDIWSVGVIFYQLLSGCLPFEQADITSLLGAILTRDPKPLPSNVPKPLQNVIARALVKDPSLRYKSAAEMRAALRNPHETDPNFQPDKSVFTVQSPKNTASPQYFHAPTEKKSNTQHLVYAIAGLLAMVIVVGGFMWFNATATDTILNSNRLSGNSNISNTTSRTEIRTNNHEIEIEEPGTPKTPIGWKVAARGTVPVNQPWTGIGRFQGKVLILMWGTAQLHEDGTSVGPDGRTEITGPPFPLPGEVAFCSILQAGSKIYKVGRSREFTFPSETQLFLGPNDEAGELGKGFKDNFGEWSYKICVPEKDTTSTNILKNVSVDAQYMWTETSVDLQPGDFATITATGQATASTSPGDAANKWVGPDGWGYQPQFNNQGKPHRWVQVLGPGSSLECMTGKVGKMGTPFKVGSTHSFTANQSGRLYLGVNHVVSDADGNRVWDNDESGRIWTGSGGNFDARIVIK